MTEQQSLFQYLIQMEEPDAFKHLKLEIDWIEAGLGQVKEDKSHIHALCEMIRFLGFYTQVQAQKITELEAQVKDIPAMKKRLGGTWE